MANAPEDINVQNTLDFLIPIFYSMAEVLWERLEAGDPSGVDAVLGKTMKRLHGRCNPAVVKDIIRVAGDADMRLL